MLEVIHNAGYIHNDISLRKIYLGSIQTLDFSDQKLSDENIFEEVILHLSDFSYLTPYKNFVT